MSVFDPLRILAESANFHFVTNGPANRLPERGCLTAIAIGIVTVVVDAGAFSAVTGNSLDLQDEWYAFLFQILLVAAPFGLLSLLGMRDRVVWALGIGLTAALWGYSLYDGIRYQLSGDTSGVDFGLAFLLMLSPIFISLACIALAVWRRQRVR